MGCTWWLVGSRGGMRGLRGVMVMIVAGGRRCGICGDGDRICEDIIHCLDTL